MTIQQFCEQLPGWKPSKKEMEGLALCELHGDRNPSLWVGYKTKWGRFECRSCGRKGTLKEYAELTGKSFLEPKKENDLGEIESEFIYTDLHGKEILMARRYRKPNGDKTFRQLKPNGAEWVWGGIKPLPLYRVDLLLKEPTEVFIVEGEKAASAGIKAGLTCTTNPTGAGKFGGVGEDYLEALRPHKIYVLPDNDQVGVDHAKQVCQILAPRGIELAMVDLPGLPHKGDLYDWLHDGNSADQLRDIARSAKPYKYDPAEALGKFLTELPFTDLGNAEAILRIYGHRLRWYPPQGQWMIWNRKYWEIDKKNKAMAWANKSARARLEAAQGISDKDERRLALEWAKQSENASRRDAALRQVQAYTTHVKNSDDMDRDPWKVSVANGTLDLKTGKLLPHNPYDYITKMIPVDYDPDAKCDLWIKVLNRAMAEDQLLINYLQQACGYCLTGATNEHAVFICWGQGNNGKSLFIETICSILGGYARTTRSETFAVKEHADAIGDALARLNGSRLVKCSETNQSFRLDEAQIKGLSGEDTITARFLFKDFFEFQPTFKVWMVSNHKPIIGGTDFGIWRRLKLIPWLVTIPSEEVDRDLKFKLREELPGILAWMVRGCLNWQKAGRLIDPPAVLRALEEYKKEQDTVGQFITECCSIEHSCAEESLNLLYGAFQAWSKDAGHRTPMHKQTLTKKLAEKGYKSVRRGKQNTTFVIGIHIVSVPNNSRGTAENEKTLSYEERKILDEIAEVDFGI